MEEVCLMPANEPTQEELDDAIIEDTVHCDFCGASWTLGGNADGICVQSPRRIDAIVHDRLPAQLKFCIDCAAFIARTYQQNVKHEDICPHGVCAGDWCIPCHQEFIRDDNAKLAASKKRGA